MTSDNSPYCKPASRIRSTEKMLTLFYSDDITFRYAFLCHSGVPGSIFAEPPGALKIDAPPRGDRIAARGDRWGVYPTGIALGAAEGGPGVNGSGKNFSAEVPRVHPFRYWIHNQLPSVISA